MDNEYNELLAEYQKLAEIAQRLDSLNPTLPNAFIGTISQRIMNQLVALDVLK
jgi:hypothetical protein